MASRKVIKFSVCLIFLAFCNSNSLECDDVEMNMLMTDFDLLMDRFNSRFWYPGAPVLFSLFKPRLQAASVLVVQEPLSDISIVTCRRRLSSIITSLIDKLLDSTKCSRLSISSTLEKNKARYCKIPLKSKITTNKS